MAEVESPSVISRREFVTRSTLMICGGAIGASNAESAPEPVIDIHQHLGYSGRPDDVLLAHQRAMGISTTILLPAGRPINSVSTHEGISNGLQANCLGNEACYQFAKANFGDYFFGAN